MIAIIIVSLVLVFILGLYLGFKLCKKTVVKPLLVLANILISSIEGKIDTAEALRQIEEYEEKFFGIKK